MWRCNLRNTWPPYRILLTGTRGKSTAVRYIAAALDSIGISFSARITGTVPMVIEGLQEKRIVRNSPAHISEMIWWIRNIPEGTQAVVAENSAVSPELQPLSARWLDPGLIVWTSVLPDHAEYWGPHLSGAREALLNGVPRSSRVLLGNQAGQDRELVLALEKMKCTLFTTGMPVEELSHQYETIAVEALNILGLPGSEASFRRVPIDPHEFRIVNPRRGGAVAWAFSSNDPVTAEALFRSTGWDQERTALLFNHRHDRPSRLSAHLPWIRNGRWKRRIITGDRPLVLTGFSFFPPSSAAALADLVRSEGTVFGCGNVRGLPFAWEVEAS
jgi:hypothetical protein